MSAAWKVAKGSRKVVSESGELIAMVMPAESPEATSARACLVAAAPQLEEQRQAALAHADALQAELDEARMKIRGLHGMTDGWLRIVDCGHGRSPWTRCEVCHDSWDAATSAAVAPLAHLLAWQQARGIVAAEWHEKMDAQSGEIVRLAMRHDVSPVEALVALSDGLTVHAERDALRAENERLQRDLDNPALRDSVIAGLDQELQAAYREELAAKAEAKRLREVLAWLDRKGSLGFDAHDRITAALSDAKGGG